MIICRARARSTSVASASRISAASIWRRSHPSSRYMHRPLLSAAPKHPPSLLPMHHPRFQVMAHFASIANNSEESSTANNNSEEADGSLRHTPIHAFIDLDNVQKVGLKTVSRDSVRAFLRPLRELGQKINGQEHASRMGKKKSPHFQISAFGNLPTRTWKTDEDRERSLEDQEYIAWDGETCQSGVDDKGILRCGVCAAKIRLTKKDIKKGRDLKRKLLMHMKIHLKERGKERARIGQLKKKSRKKAFTEKMQPKWDKYQAAMVGVSSMKLRGVDKQGKPKFKARNDLFQILREQNVKVRSSDDVDEAIIEDATRWMRDVNKNAKEDLGGWKGVLTKEDLGRWKGVLVVYSKDGDFAPLLTAARSNGFLAVSASDSKASHTSNKLLRSSDIVLGRFGIGEASSIMQETNQEEDDGECSSDDDNARWDGDDLSEVDSDDEDDILSFDDHFDDDGYIVRDVASESPLSFMALAEKDAAQGGMQALALTGDGRDFMNEMGNGATVWQLGEGHRVEVNETVDEEDPAPPAGLLRSSPQKLHRQHLPDQYKARSDAGVESGDFLEEARSALSSLKQLRRQHGAKPPRNKAEEAGKAAAQRSRRTPAGAGKTKKLRRKKPRKARTICWPEDDSHRIVRIGVDGNKFQRRKWYRCGRCGMERDKKGRFQQAVGSCKRCQQPVGPQFMKRYEQIEDMEAFLRRRAEKWGEGGDFVKAAVDHYERWLNREKDEQGAPSQVFVSEGEGNDKKDEDPDPQAPPLPVKMATEGFIYWPEDASKRVVTIDGVKIKRGKKYRCMKCGMTEKKAVPFRKKVKGCQNCKQTTGRTGVQRYGEVEEMEAFLRRWTDSKGEDSSFIQPALAHYQRWVNRKNDGAKGTASDRLFNRKKL